MQIGVSELWIDGAPEQIYEHVDGDGAGEHGQTEHHPGRAEQAPRHYNTLRGGHMVTTIHCGEGTWSPRYTVGRAHGHHDTLRAGHMVTTIHCGEGTWSPRYTAGRGTWSPRYTAGREYRRRIVSRVRTLLRRLARKVILVSKTCRNSGMLSEVCTT